MQAKTRARIILSAVCAPLLLSVLAAGADPDRYKVLHSFNASVDGWSLGALAIPDAEELYGVAQGGGPNNNGTVFRLTRRAHGWKMDLLYTFPNWKEDGQTPNGPLVFNAAGGLYGTTAAGGNSRGFQPGVAFNLTPASSGPWTEDVLHTFCSLYECQDGSGPWAGLIWDSVGNLYGTTEGSGNRGIESSGTVFELSPGASGWTESVLYTFVCAGGTGDGCNPEAPVAWDALGNLYGTTTAGGNNQCGGSGCGIVFQLVPNGDGTWKENIIHRFGGFFNDGAVPYSGVTLDAQGNVYGTTAGGGVVFELTP
jgi:uncharacterized repeat protein (TIGR03803 family)